MKTRLTKILQMPLPMEFLGEAALDILLEAYPKLAMLQCPIDARNDFDWMKHKGRRFSWMRFAVGDGRQLVIRMDGGIGNIRMMKPDGDMQASVHAAARALGAKTFKVKEVQGGYEYEYEPLPSMALSDDENNFIQAALTEMEGHWKAKFPPDEKP